MKQISKIDSLMKVRKAARLRGTIGFVPTMGAFHDGHLSLIQKAREECDFVIVSLFVNPLQFDEKADLSNYPRSLSNDSKKVASTGADVLWTPTEKILFPAGFQTSISVGEISRRWEGVSRPGHFQGVATIVAKLLQIVCPDSLYLGQKDYQQVCVIRRMMCDLHFETEVQVLPIIREADGLAMSSRNQRLSPSKRAGATVIYRALQAASKRVQAGERNSAEILKAVADILQSSADLSLEYACIVDPVSLEPINDLEVEGILLVAVKLGGLRLIDNILLKVTDE